MIAEAMETVFTDTDAISRISDQIRQQDKTLWEKIADFLKGLVEKLRKAYKGVDPDSRTAQEMRPILSTSEKILDAYVNAAVSAIEQYNTLSATQEATAFDADGEPVAHSIGDGTVQLSKVESRFSPRDTRNVPQDIRKIVDDALDNKNDYITISYASAWDNKVINRLGEQWRGKYTGAERTITSRYIRHVIKQHGNALTEALRGQLYMDADAIKIALSKLREGNGRIVEGTSSRRANPTITTEIPINGYTIYVEEPMSGLSDTSLEGRTMYLMPTSTTALMQANMPTNIPQRRSGLKPIIDASDRIVNGNLSGSDGKPIRLHTVDFQSPEFNANRANGVYCMSTDIDALNTTNQPVNTGEFFAAIKNPYIVTAANPIITDEDIRNGLVANRISEVKRAGYDAIIMDYHTGDNYFVMVFDKNSIVAAENSNNNADNESMKSSRNSNGDPLTAEQAEETLPEEFSVSDVLKSSRVKDRETLRFLDDQDHITTYRSMQLIDGKLHPPMAAIVNGNTEDYSELGKWEEAVEHPELIKIVNGKPKFTLNKGKGQGSVDAAYNPYMHSSNLVINDQFSGAYTRPNLVVVECHVPVSELSSGYRAQYAKDTTGWHSWHTGTVAGALRKAKGIERQVVLSRWIKPVRILSNQEVAAQYKELLSGTDISVPDNVVSPGLLAALREAGVNITESGRIKNAVAQKNNTPGGAKKSNRYSYANLIAKPDMNIVDITGIDATNRSDIIYLARENALSAGGKSVFGSVSVHVNDNGRDVILSSNGLKHGLDRRKNDLSAVTIKAGEIIKNSIQINELTPSKGNASGSYILIGMAQNSFGDRFVVRSVVNQFDSELKSMDVLYAINAKKEPAALNAPGLTAKPLSVTGSTISISELLESVNNNFPDILPEDVLKHFGYDSRPVGQLGESALYSSRNKMSEETKAAIDAYRAQQDALSKAQKALYEQERKEIVKAYKDKLKNLERSYSEEVADIQKAFFSLVRSYEAKVDEAGASGQMVEELTEALKQEVKAHDIDRELWEQEFSRLSREYERLKGSSADKVKALEEKVQHQREAAHAKVESARKTEMRHKIQNTVNTLNRYLLNPTKDIHVPDSITILIPAYSN